MISKETVKNLQFKAKYLRKKVVETVYNAKSGHIGGSLSAAEILTVLYFHEMKLNTENSRDEKRDRFVLSKGHITPAYYSILAMRGFFSEEELKGFRKNGSKLQGHPDRNKVCGVDMSSGSLGQGVSSAVGIALAGKLKNSEYRVYTLLGDGEIQEGQVWEAAMFASQHKLDNLCVIVDNNDVQSGDFIKNINSPYPIDKKFKAFGFNVISINGNDIKLLINAFLKARKCKGKPTAIIAKTIKGKGVSFMENKASWHGKVPSAEEFEKAIKELGE